jgi:arabinogalactan oligomer / maltooligosaccharide transport system substrate-binding protein
MLIRRLLAAWAALLLISCAAPSAPATPAPATRTPVATRPSATPSPAPRATATRVAASPSPAPEPSPAPADTSQPLTVWAVATDERREALRSLVADAAHVAGVEITLSLKSADGLSADVRAAELAGLPLPDVVWGNQDDLGILQRAGAIQPAAEGLRPEEFLPAVVEGGEVAGQRWGTPVAAQGFLLLLYNRALVSAPPRTSDELILQARRLTGGGSYGIVAGWAEPRWFSAWLHGLGGAALAPDAAPALDTPETIAAINLLKELRVSGQPPPSSYAQGARLFRDGRVAFAIDGDWSLGTYRQYTETLDLGIAPMPRVDSTGRPAVGPLGGTYLMYGAGLEGERLERAYALGRLLARPEFQERVARDLEALPALRAALQSPAVRGNPALTAAAANAEEAPGIPPLDELRCAWDAIEAALPSAILGDLTNEQAAARMQELALGCVRSVAAR